MKSIIKRLREGLGLDWRPPIDMNHAGFTGPQPKLLRIPVWGRASLGGWVYPKPAGLT